MLGFKKTKTKKVLCKESCSLQMLNKYLLNKRAKERNIFHPVLLSKLMCSVEENVCAVII